VEEVCHQLGVSRSVAYEAASLLLRRLAAGTGSPNTDEVENIKRALRERDFENECLRYERDHPGCRVHGAREQLDAGYKEAVEAARARHGVTLVRASELLSIPLDTLKKFSRFTTTSPGGTCADAPEKLPAEVVELVNAWLRGGGCRSLKAFCERHPEVLSRLGLNYRQALRWLGELGFVNRRGIFLKNKGLDKIIRFRPNQVWGSDGKRIPVIINGEVFVWLWQCLVDQKTTVIVGNIVENAETTENLKTATDQAIKRIGKAPLAIVLDNRLSENLPAVREFLNERGIEVVKTFPGNPKSNGITEGNFAIFDRWVGAIRIDGSKPEELSRSIAAAFVEVFTQLRNHKPRKTLSLKTPKEVMDEIPPATPEEEAAAREKLVILAARLKNEQARPEVSAEKKVAIEQAISETAPPHPDVFTKVLHAPIYTADLILQSIAILGRQRELHPEKRLDHAYFGGILRNLVDQRSVECLDTHLNRVYAQHWDTMGRLAAQDRAASIAERPDQTCTRLATDFLNMPVPAYAARILIDLKESFYLACRGSARLAASLRATIADTVLQSKRTEIRQRETLLSRLFEWENFVRICDRASADLAIAPEGNA